MKIPLTETSANPEAVHLPEPDPVEEQPDEKLRNVLLQLVTRSGLLTVADLLAALDTVYTTVKRSRKIVSAPSKGVLDKMPLPSITVSGKCLEATCLRVSKMVTVRIAQNLILISLDNEGPDPKVDAEYDRIKNYRQNMQDVYDKMLFGRPVRELLEYAHAKMQGEEQLTKVAEPE